MKRWASELAGIDRRWSAWMAQTTEAHPSLYWLSRILAHAGDAVLWMGIGGMVFVWGSPRARDALLQTVIAVACTALLVAGIKFGVRRERPRGEESAKWSLLPKHDLYSFPSGHAARAACIATGVAAAYPDVRLPFIIWMAGVCVSRVALAAHYLIDVLVGVVIGVVVGTLVTRTWSSIASLLGQLRLW